MGLADGRPPRSKRARLGRPSKSDQYCRSLRIVGTMIKRRASSRGERRAGQTKAVRRGAPNTERRVDIGQPAGH